MKTIELSEQEMAAIAAGDTAEGYNNLGWLVGYVTYQVQQAANAVGNAVSGAFNQYVNTTAMMAQNNAWQMY